MHVQRYSIIKEGYVLNFVELSDIYFNFDNVEAFHDWWDWYQGNYIIPDVIKIELL